MKHIRNSKKFFKSLFIGITILLLSFVPGQSTAAGLAELATAKSGRWLALGCVAMLTAGHVARTMHYLEDPLRSPSNVKLQMPWQSRRTLIESLLSRALNKPAGEGGGSESAYMTVLERDQNRMSGYMFLTGFTGYFITYEGSEGETLYKVFSPESGELLETGAI